MISTNAQFRNSLRLIVTVGLFVVLSFVGNLQRAAAVPMSHMGGGKHESCAAACAQLTNNAPQQAILDQNEIRTPDPVLRVLEPYFVQFLRVYEPKMLRPAQTLGAYTIRPPDIVALTTNYRF